MQMSKLPELVSGISDTARKIRSYLLRHKWAVYFTMIMLAVLYLIIQGIQEIVWARYYAITRATEFLREAKFSPGPQPDATAAGTLNAVWATLHAAYAAAYFSIASPMKIPHRHIPILKQ